MKPLAIDLYAGLGGWTEGLLAEGYRVVGFDIERHAYGEAKYPAQLVLQDVRTLHGAQFKDAALIVASPPCQAYSYRAMPWKRAKALPPPSNELFDACFRIQREACEAAGRHIPLVVENVRGAQPYVGRARWHFGSFYLWGDVPALMPMPSRRGFKGSVGTINGSGKHREQSSWDRGVKVPTMGAGWYPPGHPKHVPGFGVQWTRGTSHQRREPRLVQRRQAQGRHRDGPPESIGEQECRPQSRLSACRENTTSAGATHCARLPSRQRSGSERGGLAGDSGRDTAQALVLAINVTLLGRLATQATEA